MSIEGLDLNLVTVLHHVLAERSVARAAERLHVTPSAVSNSLARLREVLGDALLVRNGRQLVPTPRALDLAPEIASVVARMRGIFEVQSFDPATCERRFTLASADNIGLLPEVARRFGSTFPRASLRVISLDHAISTDALASGDVDLLLGVLQPNTPPDYRSEPAYTERLTCAVWTGNRAIGRSLTLERFLAAKHIQVTLQGKYAMDAIDAPLAELGHQRQVAVSVPQFGLAAMCVVGTSYVTMLPATMARQLAAALPIRICKPPLPLPAVTIVQLWHVRSDGDPGTAMLRRVVRQAGLSVGRERRRPGRERDRP
ncbi:MAG TPA: LysR family transcriptional regulator [Myxococcales bacterium]|nr:LysR family transcriptional regulator [Myxococcales bacterium]